MKLLHTADWHLGKRLDFAHRITEQKEVLDEICQLADYHAVDMVIVAGDLFDAFNPPVEATELLYKTLKRLTKNGKRPVVAIAGNHDSPDRIDSPDPLARECGIIFIGYPNAAITPLSIEDGFSITHTDLGFLEFKIPHIGFPVRLLTTPYANEIRLKQFLGITDKATQLHKVLENSWANLASKYCDTNGVNLLTAHLYMLQRAGEVLEEPEGERPIKIGNADIIYTDAIPPQIQYTALGHLHRYQHIAGHNSPVLYSSSPLAYSFSEAGQTKHIVLVDLYPNQAARVTPVALTKGRKLYRKQFTDVDSAVNWLHANPNTWVELTLVSDNYISSAELKRLHESHDGIIHIIPVVAKNNASQQDTQPVKLDQDIYGLFKDFFRNKYGQDPNDEINDLFKEVLAQNKDLED
ncbi:metallophosphoesterase family protein [Sphingobacterium sp. Mn56C]|uniref:metallophosphoesterase family protein n=1 Tax=Sphingobacterium sp. Mn56C TaxID=3395261 RepID=UPI003BCF43DF